MKGLTGTRTKMFCSRYPKSSSLYVKHEMRPKKKQSPDRSRTHILWAIHHTSMQNSDNIQVACNFESYYRTIGQTETFQIMSIIVAIQHILVRVSTECRLKSKQEHHLKWLCKSSRASKTQQSCGALPWRGIVVLLLT